MHLYIFSLIYIFYGYGSVNVDHFIENFILSFYRSFFRKYWLQFDLLSDNGYIYIYIYIYKSVSKCHRLPHPRSGDCQGQETF